MRRRVDPRGSVLLTLLLATSAGAAPAGGDAPGGILGLGGLGGNRKDPITVTADNLEYDYKSNVVVYKGTVEVVQGDVKLKSDNLTITLAGDAKDAQKPAEGEPAASPDESARVKEIVALGNVRIDQGARWAVGGRAVFDQDNRTLVLTESPVLHEGKNEVAGDRVVVFLDEDRSVVEGGRKRVKAVFFPGSDGGGGGPAKPAGKPNDKPKKKRGETAAAAERP
jgi:lipopolysaccharide export system protein LptA